MYKQNPMTVLKSIGSLIGGVHSNEDALHTDIMHEWRGKRDQSDFQNDDLKFYKRTINHQNILWAESTHGAYAVVDCDLPEKIGKDYHDVAHATALFSKDTEALERLLTGQSHDIENIRTLPIHSHQDMSSNGYVRYELFSEMITAHHKDFSKRKAENNVFIFESNRLIRSNTALIYGMPSKTHPKHLDYYLYTFPNAEEGLFTTEDILDTATFKSTILPLSIKINDAPVHNDDASRFVKDVTSNIIKDYEIYVPPMKRYIDKAVGLSKTRKQISHSIKTTLQPMTHLVARLKRMDVISGTASSVLFAVAFAMFSGLKAAGAGMALFSLATIRAIALNNNNINKAMSGITKYISRTLNKKRTNIISRLYDKAPDFTTVQKFLEVTKRIDYPMPPPFYDGIKLVDYGCISQESLTQYDQKTKKDWADKRKTVSDGAKSTIFVSLIGTPNGQAKFLSVSDYDGNQQSFPIAKTGKSYTQNTNPSTARTLSLLGKKRHAKAEERPGWLVGKFTGKSRLPTLYLGKDMRVDDAPKSPRPLGSVAPDAPVRRL